MTPRNYTQDQMLEIAIDCNAQDLAVEEDNFLIYTEPNLLHQVKNALENKQVQVTLAELIFKPEILIEVTDAQKNQLIKLLEALYDSDDVHAVFTNVKLV